MLLDSLLTQIRSSPLMLHSSGHDSLTALVNSLQNGYTPPDRKAISISSTLGQNYGHNHGESSSSNPFDNWDEGSIIVIPLNGIMLKNGSWFYFGVDELAQILKMAYQSPNIAAVLFKGNTPGGATDSVYVMEETLRNKTKPTYMLVDGTLCSCGMYVGCFCDKIYAINDMCQVGSIGVFGRLIGPGENSGYKIVEVYPDESHLKNYPEREALNGNIEPMKAELSRLAIHFQNIIKENRPGITDKDAFAGKTYFAKDAAQIGLIDAVKSEADTIAELVNLTKNVPSKEVQNEITSMLN